MRRKKYPCMEDRSPALLKGTVVHENRTHNLEIMTLHSYHLIIKVRGHWLVDVVFVCESHFDFTFLV